MKTKVQLRVSGSQMDFHNSGPISIIVNEDDIFEEGEPHNRFEAVKLSASQVKRVAKHYCPFRNCICGSGPLYQYDWDKWQARIYR